MVDGHPTESELHARAEFRLSLDSAKVVDDHLRVCSPCTAQYRNLAKGKPSPPPAPELIRGLEHQPKARTSPIVENDWVKQLAEVERQRSATAETFRSALKPFMEALFRNIRNDLSVYYGEFSE